MNQLDDLLARHLPPEIYEQAKVQMARRSRAFGFAEAAQKLREYAQSALLLVDQVEELMWIVDDEDLTNMQDFVSKLRRVHEFRMTLDVAGQLAPFERREEVFP